MKKTLLTFAAVASVAIAASPTRATTFPELTTIYVASGVVENFTADVGGIMTAVSCSNMSGQTASVRYIFRYFNGTIAATGTLLLANLASQAVTTQGGNTVLTATQLPTGGMTGGTVQILSTQSAVFCSAVLAYAGGNATGPAGVALHMVRFNPHPGTVE